MADRIPLHLLHPVDGADGHHDGPAPDARRITIRSVEDERAAANEPGRVLVDSEDWTIIPLENLIAARRDRPDSLYALARSSDEAALFRDTLQIGVHGIVLDTDSATDVRRADELLRARGPRPDDSPVDAPARPFLEPAVITRIDDAGSGDRVCIDCTSAFSDGEGLLVGSTARGFALVHAETIQSEYVNARPFRVNAGAIHSYLLGPGDRTQYLSEAAAGGTVLAVAADGSARELTIGRAKIEQRPHTLIAWETADGHTGNAILQTAETIRLVAPDGTVTSITELATGDSIMVHTETAARHFGMAVKEKLEER